MSSLPPSASLLEHFSALRDPRQRWRVLYPLPEILLLVLCATLSGMEDFVEIRLWGDERLDFLRRFLPYERGLPAHDTLNDVINELDAELFKACFAAWVEALPEKEPDIIAIDGKTSRRSHARGNGREPLHLVSAWATRQRLVLGQQAIDEKSNEILAIPLLLEWLELAGALVTIDAMGTQSDIAEKIVPRGGDYLLALKPNRPLLHQEAAAFFDDPPADMLQPAYQTTDGDHGRIEEWRHLVHHQVAWLFSDRRYADEPRFPHLAMIGMVETRVERNGAIAGERRYYLSSAKLDAKAFAAAVRAHWGVENRLHWVLDVVFHDDLARLRTGHGPQNMAVVKHMAMNLVRHPKDKHSLKVRRKLANLNPGLSRKTHATKLAVNLKRLPCPALPPPLPSHSFSAQLHRVSPSCNMVWRAQQRLPSMVESTYYRAEFRNPEPDLFSKSEKAVLEVQGPEGHSWLRVGGTENDISVQIAIYARRSDNGQSGEHLSLLLQKIDATAVLTLAFESRPRIALLPPGYVDWTLTQTFEAVAWALPTTSWLVLHGSALSRSWQRAILSAAADARPVKMPDMAGVGGADGIVRAVRAQQEQHLAAEMAARASPGFKGVNEAPITRSGGFTAAGRGSTIDPLADLKRVSDVLGIARGLPHDRQAKLIEAAEELARALPIEIAVGDAKGGSESASWTVDQPKFADLLNGPAAPTPQPNRQGAHRTVYDPQPWDNRSFSPDDRQSVASALFAGLRGSSTLDHPSLSYRGGPPGVGGFVLRARGLAMLFQQATREGSPFSRAVFDAEEERLAEITDALEAVKSSPLAKALGMLTVAGSYELGILPLRSRLFPDPGATVEGVRAFSRILVKAVGEIRKALFRARMALVAFERVSQPLRAELARIGYDALDELTASEETASNDAALATVVLLHDGFAMLPLLTPAMTGADDGSSRRIAASAVNLARRMGDPSIKAVFLLGLSRWFADASGSSDLLYEAVKILDDIQGESHPIDLQEFQKLRGVRPDNAQDRKVSFVDPALTRSIALWGAGTANAWFALEVPETLPSLGPLRFPEPRVEFDGKLADKDTRTGAEILPPIRHRNLPPPPPPSKRFAPGLASKPAAASQPQEHAPSAPPAEAPGPSTDPGAAGSKT